MFVFVFFFAQDATCDIRLCLVGSEVYIRDRWYVVCGMWYVVCGMWYVVCGMWYVVCGMWYVVCGVWHVECGMWHVVCGMWNMECGIWNMVCGMWHVPRVKLCEIYVIRRISYALMCFQTTMSS